MDLESPEEVLYIVTLMGIKLFSINDLSAFVPVVGGRDFLSLKYPGSSSPVQF